jgi:hypothetical protein
VDVTINRQRRHIADKSFLANNSGSPVCFAAVGAAAAGCDPVSQPSLSVWLLVKTFLVRYLVASTTYLPFKYMFYQQNLCYFLIEICS